MRLPQSIPGLAVLLAFSASINAQPYTWDSMAIGGGGFVSAVIPSKTEQGLVYARTDVGGAYRWDKAAARWIPLLDWASDSETGYLGVESLAVDPKDAKHVVMLAGINYFNDGKTAILRSTNGGARFDVIDVSAQFKAHGNGMGRQNGEKLSFDPGSSNILYVGTRANGLFKSTNWGYQWTRMTGLDVSTTPNNNGISFVLPDPSSVSGGAAQRLFVGVSRYSWAGANFYRSNNAGTSFTAVSGGPGWLMPQRAVPDGAGNVFITYANGAGPHGNGKDGKSGTEDMNVGQIWKYTIDSGTWTDVTPAGITAAFGGISVAKDNPKRLVASTTNMYGKQGDEWGDQVFTSNDGGASWTNVMARGFAKDKGVATWPGAIHWAGSVEFDPFDSKAVWVTSGNGIFKTANIDSPTTTWRFDVKGIEETVPLNLVSVQGGPVVSVVGDFDGFRHDSATTYAQIHKPFIGTTTGLAHAVANKGALVRVGGGDSQSMYYTWDGGSSWTKTTMNGKNGQVALSPNGGTLLHSPKDSTISYRSHNMGASWTAINNLNIANAYPVADTISSTLFYAYDRSNGKFWTSYDSGVNFYHVSNLPTGGSERIRVAPNTQGDIWVPLNGGGLTRSSNSGTSFSKVASVSDCAAIGFGKADVNASYPTIFIWGTVKGVRGLFRSTDTGASWVRVNDDAHEFGGPGNGNFVVGDMNTFGVVYMSTAGRGVVYGKP